MAEKLSDFAYLDTMNDFLELVIHFAEEARNAQDEIRMGLYLKTSSRCLREALKLYGDRLENEMKQGEENDDVSRNGNLQ